MSPFDQELALALSPAFVAGIVAAPIIFLCYRENDRSFSRTVEAMIAAHAAAKIARSGALSASPAEPETPE